MIELDKSDCTDLRRAGTREWLETNGIGGFACSTVVGMNTRRYHGLLIAATAPPVGRVVMLSKLEETVIIGDRRIDLSTNQYQGAIHPRGFEWQTGFRLDPFPIQSFEIDGIRIDKTVFMAHGSNTTVVEYRLGTSAGRQSIRLEVRPLIAFRDYHSTTHENGGLNPAVEQMSGLASVAPYAGLPRLYMAHNASRVDTQGFWYRQFFYQAEAERGLDCIEDLFSPLVFEFELTGDQAAVVIASTEPQKVGNAERFCRAEVARRDKITNSVAPTDPLARQLALAADQFLVKRGEGQTVIAGYPWFTDWGRDTMIALPGLTLATGNARIAKGILREFAHSVDQGMLPNRFPDAGETPEFNTVDATLWFFEAVRSYLAHTGDEAFVRDELYGVLKNIIECHMRGTRYNIRMLEDGLLNAGEPGVQLTWMDAKVGNWVVTPRSGKPVEIQALWYNALKIMEDLAAGFGDAEAVKRYRTAAALVQWTFNRAFWNAESNCLYDVVNGGQPDASIRPNQLFAISLHYSMLTRDRSQQILEVMERHLLTPFGLRTLSPNDPNYRPRYEGGPYERDSAYHQGTVWPWLLGAYITAFLKINGNSAEMRARARGFLKPIEEQFKEGALGQISEVYDAEAPQLPKGCFAQAWSVGELLRVLCEELAEKKTQPDADLMVSRVG